MPKFVTARPRAGSLLLFCALFLLNGCGDGTDATKAKATFKPDGVALDQMEKALPQTAGILVDYEYKPDKIQVESVSFNEEVRTNFPTVAKHHYALSTRYNLLSEFNNKIDAFLKEHDDFLRGTALKERYDKLTAKLREELEAERKQFADNKAPEYGAPEKEQFDTLDQQMSESTAHLAEEHNVVFTVTKSSEAGKYEVSLNDASEWTGDTDEVRTELENLQTAGEEYLTLLASVGDVPLSDVLTKKNAAIEAVLP